MTTATHYENANFLRELAEPAAHSSPGQPGPGRAATAAGR